MNHGNDNCTFADFDKRHLHGLFSRRLSIGVWQRSPLLVDYLLRRSVGRVVRFGVGSLAVAWLQKMQTPLNDDD